MSSKQSREQALEIQRRVRNAVREAVSARRIQSSAGPITEKATEEETHKAGGLVSPPAF